MVFHDSLSRALFKTLAVGKVLGYDWHGTEIISSAVYDIYSLTRKLP